MRLQMFALLAGAAVAFAPADAAVTLLARGTLSGSSAGVNADLSGLKGNLENGVAANFLGGIGSGLTYAGGTTFLSVPDRGPNATPYNALVDDTASYISRVQTLDLSLTPGGGGSLPFSLTPTLTKTTLLYSPTPLVYGTGVDPTTGAALNVGPGAPAKNDLTHYYFSGRSDNYGAGNSGVAADARFDPESIRVSNDGQHVFISDEYGPYVREFNRASGALERTYSVPTELYVSKLSPQGAVEISGNTIGRTANKGMEGLSITPDGKTLVGIMQAPLLQDVPAKKSDPNIVRIVTIDVASGATHEYAYQLTTGSGVSDIVAVNATTFLVDERDGKGLGDGSTAAVKQIFRIDIAGATDITGKSGAKVLAPFAVTKSATPFVDLVSALGAIGVAPTDVPAKIEGITFGQDVTYNGQLLHTFYLANDNDFIPGTAGENQFFVFGFQDSDLPGYVAQRVAAVPEPASWAMMIGGFGLLGGAMRRRAKVRATVRFA